MADDTKPIDKKDEGISGPQIVAALKYVLAETQKVAKKYDDLEVKLRNQQASTPPPAPKGEEKDIEALTNSELAEHIVKQVSTSILTPIQKQLSELSTKHDRSHLENQIKEATKEYPDFWEYKPEIQKRIEDNPNLSLDDAYHLARKDNKDKTAELDKKRAEEAAAARAAEEAKKPAFAGLLPTSSLTKPNSKMEPKDAANSAWDEVMAAVPQDMLH